VQRTRLKQHGYDLRILHQLCKQPNAFNFGI
jgi:hypothetical protein